MPRTAFELAASRTWLMTAEALDTLLAVADRQGDVEALEARLGRPLDNTRNVTVRDGVAVIPITGPVFRYANLFTEISGAVSTEMLVKDIQTALDDPSIQGIVLNIDSPGGEATGINELSDLIYNARGQKPIKAYAGGQMASALYWVGSAADEVIVDDTAQLGSVGVVLSLRKREDRPGEKSYEIVSSNAPNKRPDPETEAGRAQLQARTDELAAVFLDKVARNRDLPRDEVNDRFRQGGVATGALAVEAGMADRLGSLESVIAELAGTSASSQPRSTIMTTVKTTAELQAAIEAGTDPKSIKIAEPEAVDTDKLKTEATEAERARCKGILELASPGFEKEVAAAIDEGASVEATGLKLFRAAQDRGLSLSDIAADGTQTSTAQPPADDKEGEERKSAVSAITGAWKD
ncbi:S49 family peptidase [Halomonas elongata]|uniref:Peptidase S49 family protein n=1 Tax=Halomonas elongata (strain ATCC 33173 / DSM 2581 / NBRC 15536 / NCIMB 2198 / 1H9) TaxID=768066 RepID=E1VAX0_HALED|nr:S49 family peptidase [Halomonas elongata]WBF17825.1 S49 family peptidase [Halomonas elongata]WPU46670.1 S49 family peptidase [Halomonas elongata DSM 2581]CBV44069.1 peptidase S49 family protein [Halomonas elongata DSM 2581]